jgi:TPP-dependent 2-oxoacid decarboxylase
MWNYTEFVLSIANGNRNVFVVKVTTNGELVDALHQSSLFEGLSFIECKIPRDECTENLLEWGSKVAEANSRREC